MLWSIGCVNFKWLYGCWCVWICMDIDMDMDIKIFKCYYGYTTKVLLHRKICVMSCKYHNWIMSNGRNIWCSYLIRIATPAAVLTIKFCNDNSGCYFRILFLRCIYVLWFFLCSFFLYASFRIIFVVCVFCELCICFCNMTVYWSYCFASCDLILYVRFYGLDFEIQVLLLF